MTLAASLTHNEPLVARILSITNYLTCIDPRTQRSSNYPVQYNLVYGSVSVMKVLGFAQTLNPYPVNPDLYIYDPTADMVLIVNLFKFADVVKSNSLLPSSYIAKGSV